MDDAKLLGEILASARTKACKSQDEMSHSLGISKNTVYNWEKGTSQPNMRQLLLWFKTCGLNPFPYMLQYVFPGSFTASSTDDTEKLRSSLHDYVDSMPEDILRLMAFVTFGQHGSSSFSVVQMMSAHLHTSMQSRVIAARVIKESYEMCMDAGTIVCPDEALPDLAMLEDGIVQGKDAVKNGINGYSTNKK